MNPLAPSPSALNQQRDKLSSDALQAVFMHFNSFLSIYETPSNYRFIAADGFTFTFFSRPCFASQDYHVREGYSSKGFYSMHLNALYNLHKHTYTMPLSSRSYNNMAHVINKGQFFLFRSKDIHSKGLLHNFDFPDEGSFDVTVNVSLVRSHSRRLSPADGYSRFVDKAASFDFLGFSDTLIGQDIIFIKELEDRTSFHG